MTQERRSLVRALDAAPDPLDVERLSEVDHQLPELLHRHRLVHDAMLAIYYAVAVLVVSMFTAAVAELSDRVWLSVIVLALLLLGTSVLLYGVLLTTLEIRMSRRSIVYETERSLCLHPQPSGATGPPASRA